MRIGRAFQGQETDYANIKKHKRIIAFSLLKCDWIWDSGKR